MARRRGHRPGPGRRDPCDHRLRHLHTVGTRPLLDACDRTGYRGMTRTLVVLGHGMVGHRLVTYFDAKSGAEISLVSAEFLADPLVDLRLAATATKIDRATRTVTTPNSTTPIGYDALVLATGSRPFLPPVPGCDLPGCFVYRTLDDLDAIQAAATAGRPGVVIGGGLLGLEAANALRLLGMRPHVVEM